MRFFIGTLFLFLTVSCWCHDDSTRVFRNGLSYEFGGNIWDPPGLNINYHRFFPVSDFPEMTLHVRVGCATYKYFNSPGHLMFPVEVGFMNGAGWCKLDVSAGYTPMFYMSQQSSGSEKFLQYLTLRVGMAVLPSWGHFPLIRLGLTPLFFPTGVEDSGGKLHRIYLWGGISIGATF